MKLFKKIIGLLVLFLCCLATSALACVCPTVGDAGPDFFKRQVEMKFTRAEVVFSGKVFEKNLFQVKFEVDSVWKGVMRDDFIMSTGTVNNGNGTISSTSCDYHFEEGKSYLVYASPMEPERSRGQRLLVASGCWVALFLEKAEQEINVLNEIVTPEKRNKKEQKKMSNL